MKRGIPDILLKLFSVCWQGRLPYLPEYYINEKKDVNLDKYTTFVFVTEENSVKLPNL